MTHPQNQKPFGWRKTHLIEISQSNFVKNSWYKVAGHLIQSGWTPDTMWLDTWLSGRWTSRKNTHSFLSHYKAHRHFSTYIILHIPVFSGNILIKTHPVIYCLMMHCMLSTARMVNEKCNSAKSIAGLSPPTLLWQSWLT